MTNIKDVAARAGVSVTTVSRVLNQHPYVSEQKRKAVLRAIDELDYYPNINAVHLSIGKTHLMGVVLPYTDHPYFGLLLKGIAKKALEHNYKLVLFQTDYQKRVELEALQMLKTKQIDSLIICSRGCKWSIIEEHLQYGPIVVAEKREDQPVSATYVDHYASFTAALDYLYGKGHRKIGYTISRVTGTSSRDRDQAYKDFIKQHGLVYRADYIIDKCLYFEDGKKVIEHIQTIADPPTALLATSDQVAAGVMLCCHQMHIKVPDELAIIGFDNQPIAKMMNITTMEIPLEHMGEHLFEQALGRGVNSKEVAVSLIERGTV